MEEKKCFIKTEKGQHFAYMPDGTKIPFQVKTIVIDDASKRINGAKAHITIFVDLK